MRIRWGIALALLLGALPVWAALGEPEESVQKDRERVAGQSKRTVYPAYTLHEISGPDGRMIREYVSPAGTVFAVAWEGPTLPDLSSLLGSYYSAFEQAASSPSSSRRHGPLFVQAGPLVVESGGRMRAFRGRAYVTHLIPANLSKDVIR
jgi:hypothetical protein